MSDDRGHLQRAVELSQLGSQRGDGGPFGAVVVADGRVLGEGWNRVLIDRDPTAHAEVVAIRAACQTIGSHDLAGTVMYASCEPCPMCLAATLWARCERVVYANTRRDAADIGFDDAIFYDELALATGDRSLSMERMILPEASEVFAAWVADPHHVIY